MQTWERETPNKHAQHNTDAEKVLRSILFFFNLVQTEIAFELFLWTAIFSLKDEIKVQATFLYQTHHHVLTNMERIV